MFLRFMLLILFQGQLEFPPSAAVVAGMLGNYYNVPIISWAAKADELNDPVRFPTFARTVASTKTFVLTLSISTRSLL